MDNETRATADDSEFIIERKFKSDSNIPICIDPNNRIDEEYARVCFTADTVRWPFEKEIIQNGVKYANNGWKPAFLLKSLQMIRDKNSEIRDAICVLKACRTMLKKGTDEKIVIGALKLYGEGLDHIDVMNSN